MVFESCFAKYFTGKKREERKSKKMPKLEDTMERNG